MTSRDHRNRARGKRRTKTGAKPGSAGAEALRLIEDGMHPVPVPYQEKAPVMPGWPELRIDKNQVSAYFAKRQNIGIVLGVNGLADIDLDCQEAITAADELVPATDFVFGRESTPRAHRFYWLDTGVKTKRFRDPVDDDVLLELRCLKSNGQVGFQTIVPPSRHPCGELIRYDSRGEPANVKSDDLVRAAKWTAAVALLARHFPGEKSGRNETFLALSGTLAHAGFPLELAIHVHQAIYRVLWNDASDLDQAAREVRASYEKFNSGASVTGFTRLAELLPQIAVRQALEWMGASGGGTASLDDIPFTDLGNAQRLIQRHGDDILWCEDWRNWLVFDGRRWLRDNKQAVRALAHDTVRAIYQKASQITDPDQRKAL